MTLVIFACSKDEDPMNEEMEEMEESVDVTMQIVGTYTGTSKYVEGGSFFTEDNRTATVSTTSDSIASINITSISGTINMIADMNSETEFDIFDASIFDENYNGSGTLSSDTLKVLLFNGNKSFEFSGVK